MSLLPSKSIDYFVKVSALLVIDDQTAKSDVLAVLGDKFARGGVVEATDVKTAMAMIRDQHFDVIIAESHFADLFFARFCKEMREGRLGRHPFPIVLILMSQSDPAMIRKVIDCGPDDVLALPLNPRHLGARLYALSRDRKPFVVTRDYTGPSRRIGQRQGSEVIPEVDAPNPLAARLRRLSESSLQRDIDRAASRLIALRARRYAIQICWLALAIGETVNRVGGTDADVLGFCHEVLLTLGQVSKVGKLADLASFTDASDSLSRNITEIMEARGEFDAPLLDDIVAGAQALSDQIERLFPLMTTSTPSFAVAAALRSTTAMAEGRQ